MLISAIKTPGVYVNEVSIFPPSVAQVPTAIPAFIGYTEKAEESNSESLFLKPKKIGSMLEFELCFGKGPKTIFDASSGSGVELDANNQVVKANNKQDYFLYNSLQLFFANGGGECYIISAGKYTDTISYGDETSGMFGALGALSEVDEPTMIVFPDAVSLKPSSDLYKLQQAALMQCGKLMDRVGIFDIAKANDKTELAAKVKEFRDSIGMSDLKYGAVYAPWLRVGIKKNVRYRDLKGQLVKAGTSVVIGLETLIRNLSGDDTTKITACIAALNDITSDNDFIEKTIKDSLAAANNGSIKPAGFAGDLPSLESAFDLVVQSVNTLVANAQAETVAADKKTKAIAAANELKKLLQQLYNLVIFIDTFGFKDAAAMKNSEVIQNTHKSIGFVSPPPPPATAPPAPFSVKLQELADWNATLSDAPLKAVSQTPFALIVPAGPFQTILIPAGVVNPPGLLLNTAPAAGNAGDTARIENIKDAVVKFKDTFSFFYNIAAGIQVFGQTIEKVKEDSLLKMLPVYKGIVDAVNNSLTLLPPSGAMAGIYARVDNERGVWKAPANVSVTYATGTLVNIPDAIQDGLNIDVDAGKSVNAIRSFSGKGVMVWGARTLAGNDNEWRYISVRRFFNMVEESVKKSTSWAVFEPNDANTWLKVKSMIENFLTLLWRQGALAGSKPEEAFFVEVGLNKTMTYVDILEGRMIVKIGMAAVRPAEFIILEFSHKIQTS
jgi:uncharacterized protein